MTRQFLPADVKNALIQVCGRSFWFKDPLFEMFARAGIPESAYRPYEDEAKFKIARMVLRDLEAMGEEGYLLQRRLVTEFCKLRNLPDSEVPDREAGLSALRKLKTVAEQQRIVQKVEKASAKSRQSDAKEASQRARERDGRLTELHATFQQLAASDDRQGSGYGLEDLLKELFALFEMRYRKSYRADGEQIDGFFNFGGFDYLVEARWRKAQPSLGDLLAFKGKVDRKIESTRGLIVSINGFDAQIVNRLREAGPANLVLVDGFDLVLILEGRVGLVDALQAKIDKAAQEGVVYFSLAQLFG